MAETETASAPATPAAKKSATPKKSPKKPKAAPSHPKVSEMVNKAIGDLKEKGGSSLQAIKKYVAAHYKVDIEKLSPFVKKYLKSGVSSGVLVQTKGKGASGSFKINGKGASDKPKATKPSKPKAVAAKPKKAKPAAAKKPKAKAAPKKAAAAAKKPKAKVAPKKVAVKKPKAAKAKKAKTPAKKAGRGRK